MLLPIAVVVIAFAQPAEPQWWRGNLHTHTFWSDGNDFPEMVASWYRDNDYHFLALSDHNVLSRGEKWMPVNVVDQRSRGSAMPAYIERFGDDWVQTRDNPETGEPEVRLRTLDECRSRLEEPGAFIMIEGEEITDGLEGRPVHLNATNLTDLISPRRGDSIADVMRNNVRALQAQAEEAGVPAIIHLNHPNFHYAVTAEDIAQVVEERYFEVFNGHGSVNNLGDGVRPGTEEMWDIANTIRLASLDAPPLYGVGTDDSHTYHGHSVGSVPGRAWIMVRATELTPDAIIAAMEAGDFYASSGVTLSRVEFDAESRRLEIDIETEPGVAYVTRFIGTRKEVSLEASPRLDADGNEVKTTLRYDDAVGDVFAEVEGDSPSYQLTGDELYVRAVITSDAPVDRPSRESEWKKAWTQPVGWR